MKKIIFLIFFSSLLFYSNKAVMADTDIVRLPSISHTYIGSNGGSGGLSIDGDFNTAQVGNYGGGGPYETSSTHMFDEPYKITTLRFKWHLDAYAYANNSPGIDAHARVQYWNGSSWVNFSGPYTSFDDSRNDSRGDINTHFDSGQQVTNVNIICSGVRIWISTGTGGDGNETKSSNASIYEIQAWGNIDIGLRAYGGTGIIKIACEPAGVLTSPLRIHKNGTTYAIVLVEPGDARASRIRIRTNSGVKALAKFN